MYIIMRDVNVLDGAVGVLLLAAPGHISSGNGRCINRCSIGQIGPFPPRGDQHCSSMRINQESG